MKTWFYIQEESDTGYMKKEVKALSVVLFLAGLFFIVNSQADITGAVIGASLLSSSASSLLGFSLIVLAGVFAAQAEDRLEEKIMSSDEFGRSFRNAEPDDAKRAIVLDTSSILEYTPREMEAILEQYDHVYVPQRVLQEIHNSKLRRVIEKHSSPVKGYEKYRKIAREYLAQGKKNMMHQKIIPILLGEAEPPASRREAAPLIQESKKIFGWLQEKQRPLTRKNLMQVIDRHYRISEADVDVVATALYEARHEHKHVIVGEKDADIEDAIATIRKNNPKIRPYIDFRNPYRSAA